MPDRTQHLPEDAFEALEREAMRIGALPARERRAAFDALVGRFPDHVEEIEALVGMAASDDEITRIERVGAYQVARKLGEGGMGQVFLARRAGAHHDVALKVIRPDVESREVFRRFQREVTVLRELQHASIARFLESGEAEVVYARGVTTKSPFLAMEFVDGPTLRVFADAEDLDLRARVELMAQVCDGVAHAHSRGVVHRDLKPGNILVEKRDGRAAPKVLDFGIARAADIDTQHTLTNTGKDGLLGTAQYMSPEQIAHGAKDLGPPSDVYSLGVVLFELLTGQLPYPIAGRPLPEVARIIAEEDPTRLRSFDETMRGDLEWIVAKSLEKAPQLRYADAAEFATDLRRHLAGDAVHAHPPGVLRRATRFTRRHKVLVGVMAALVVGSISTAIFAWSARLAKLEADGTAYRANVAAAAYSIERYDVASAAHHAQLAAQSDSADTFELRHLRSRLDDSLARIDIGEGDGLSLECSADGRRVFALWRARDERGVSPIGWRLATVDVQRGQIVRQRDIESDASFVLSDGRLCKIHPGFESEPLDSTVEPFRFRADAEAFAVPASPSGALVAIVREDGEVAVERQDSTRRFALVGPLEQPLALGVDASWLLSTDNSVLRWWHLRNDPAAPIELEQRDHKPIRSLAVSSDGDLLATGGEDGYLELWTTTRDAPPERVRRLVAHRDAVEALAFSPDGRLLASAGEDRTVRLWDVESGTLRMEGLGHRATVFALTFADEGRALVSLSGRSLRIWSTTGGFRQFHHRWPAELQRHGPLLFTGDYSGRLSIRDMRSSTLVAQWRPDWMPPGTPLTSLATDGRRLAVGLRATRGVAVMNLDTGELEARLPKTDEPTNGWNVAMSRDGKLLAGHGGPRGIYLWATEGMRLVARVDKEGSSRLLAFSHDGTRLATNGPDGSVVLRDTTALAKLQELPGRVRGYGVFSPDDRRFAAIERDAVRVWNLESGRDHLRLTTPQIGVHDVAFSHDGTRIASGGSDGSLQLWDARDGTRIVTFRRHRDWIGALQFAPDDRALYTGSADGDVRIWDTTPLAARVTAAAEHAILCDELRTRAPQNAREREVARQLELSRNLGK